MNYRATDIIVKAFLLVCLVSIVLGPFVALYTNNGLWFIMCVPLILFLS